MPEQNDGCRFCNKTISCEDCESLQREYGKGAFFYIADVMTGPKASAKKIEDGLIAFKRKQSKSQDLART